MIHKGEIVAQQSMAEMLASQSMLVVRYHGGIALEGFRPDAQQIWKGLCLRNDLPELLLRLQDSGAVLIDAQPQSTLENVFEGLVLK
jgi:hypothetical protein